MTNLSAAALLKHNAQVPRYTSYPTANHFSDIVTANDYESWLSALPQELPLSLYFHIPFCKKLCWYCGCHTKASERYEPVAHYLAYLKKEVGLVAGRLCSERKVGHIHFGGGSPSYLEPDDFADFMEHVRGLFAIEPDAEIALEADPRELTEFKIATYKKAGVNRVSLGVQDFHKDVQKAINRVQPLHIIYDAVEMLRSYDIEQINMDLLYGLPGQTVESMLENATIAAGLKPNRISLFGYAHVPWMKKHMRLIDEKALPDGAARLAQFDAVAEKLKSSGYTQIGLDHFVRPDDPMAIALEKHALSRNFQGYSTDTASALLAFGASAISDLRAGYLQNTMSNHTYYAALDEGSLPIEKGVKMQRGDLVVRRLIEQLMCYMEIDLKAFAASEGLSYKYFTS
ncbi:MAG: oxygen-independent coproporphyrinogen III oxidase, partial [Kordiimonadaceae bacterium]|nr:oxygen-independent coproporphyrinogen III oxidase [Kordiimonadaceae bacterium]